MWKIIILIFLPCLLFSQICWEEGGMPIVQYANMNWAESVISLSDGNFMIVWSDELNSIPQVKAMKINSMGEHLWGSPAILKEEYGLIPDKFALCDTDAGTGIAWFEYHEGHQICCQMLDTNGNRLWGNNGINLPVEIEIDNFDKLWLTADNEGGMLLTWFFPGADNEIRSLHFDSSGNILDGWNDEGNLLLSGEIAYEVSVYSDGDSGLVIISDDHDSILLQRVNSSGELLWGDNGITRYYDEEYYNNTFYIEEDGGYSLYFNNIVNFFANIYQDEIDENGNFLNDQPQFVYDIPAQTSDIKISISFSGELFISWSDEGIVKAQKLIDQVALWGEEGCYLMDSHSSNKFLIPDNSGGCYLLQHHYEWMEESNIWCQHLNSDGNTLFEEESYSITCATEENGRLKFCNGADNIAGLFWRDESNGADRLKVQMISNNNGILLEEEGHDVLSFRVSNKNYSTYKACSDYSAYIWGDYLDGRGTILLQVLENENGTQLFPEGPVEVINDATHIYIPRGLGFDTSNDLIYFLYVSYTDAQDEFNFGIQAVDLDGEMIFGDSGIQMFSFSDFSNSPNYKFKEVNDGMLLLYTEEDHDYVEGYSWKLNKINETGFLWQEPVTLCGSSDIYPYFSWQDEYLVWEFEENIRLLKFDENGNIDPNWNNTYIEQQSSGELRNLEMFLNDEGECIVVWTADYVIMGQKFDQNGNICWEEDGRVLIAPGGHTREIHLTEDHFYFTRHTGTPAAYYVEKYDYNGVSLWENMVLLGENLNGPPPKIEMWHDNVIYYYHSPAGNLNDIKMKVIAPDGSVFLDDYYISDQPGLQDLFYCITTSDNSHILLWGDSKMFAPSQRYYNDSYYAQKIDLHTLSEDDNEIVKPVVVKNYPNPFSSETHFQLSEELCRSDAVLDIYNIKGQFIKSLPLSRGFASWNGRNQNGSMVGSAVYLYIVRTEVQQYSGKILYLGTM